MALFARLRLVVTDEYERLLKKHGLEPAPVLELIRDRGSNLLIGAFAALASYALFHLVTVFPLSWISLQSTQPINDVLTIQLVGAVIAIPCVVASGWIADRIGRRSTLGILAGLIAVFSLFAPLLLNGGALGQKVFILLGFALLGLSYGQAAGAVTANFEAHYRYTGAALTSDLAWLIGAAFAPLVALGLSVHFGWLPSVCTCCPVPSARWWRCISTGRGNSGADSQGCTDGAFKPARPATHGWQIIPSMAAVFDKPSLFKRAAPLFEGFDGPLAFAVFLLVCAGLLIMYSSGYDHGTRFVDHGRNMLIAGAIMFVVAQIPPQRLMTFAVPLYTVGVMLLIAVAIFGITKKAPAAGSMWAWWSSQVKSSRSPCR